MAVTQTNVDLNDEALEALVARVTDAQEHGLALSQADTQLLIDALITLAALQERLSDKDVTLHKLRKLLGLVTSSEKLSALVTQDQDADAGKPSDSPKKPRKKKPASKPDPITVEHHTLEGLSKGDDCPQCPKGRLAKYQPARLLRVTGSTPYTPVQHLSQRLRCNACQAYFTADLPKHVKDDGDSDQMYGFSARSLMAINKFNGGSPYYRQESLQSQLGMAITASTIYDQCEYLANDVNPIVKAIEKLAGDAIDYQIDDTGNRIVDQKPVKKKRRNSHKEQLRTGVYTSGMIARLQSGHAAILYETSIGHAGEFLDSVLRMRSATLPPPLVMSDALSSNHVTDITFIKSLCNAHARRQFVDVITPFPQEVAWVLEQYKLIWVHDAQAKEKGMTHRERLVHHHQHSLPVMASIRSWGLKKLEDGSVEENSGVGKAIRYFDKHYEGLTRFCAREGAKIDNNDMEQKIKLAVLNRKNAGFFKSAVGANVGDVLTSIMATAAAAGVNIFDYLNALQRNRARVKLNPE